MRQALIALSMLLLPFAAKGVARDTGRATADTLDLQVPSFVLQPLVENAIKHGLEPKIEGGRIAVSATAQEGVLNITVEDSGLGFGVATDTAGAGSGLANVRARLKAIYGDAARLTIEQPAEGTRIRLSLPITG